MKEDPSFHRTAYDYSHADCDALPDPFSDVLWEDIFKLGASGTITQFCEWVQVGIDVYIPHCKYSFPWLSIAYAAAIEIASFVFTNRIKNEKSSTSKVKL